MKTLIRSQMANWINTSNNFNTDDADQYTYDSDKGWVLLDRTDIYYPKVKPVLYNLPEDKYTRDYLYAFEDDKYGYMPLSVKRFLRSLPLKWLSQITSKYSESSEDILVIDDCNLPDFIKSHVKSYYVKHYEYSDRDKWSTVIFSNIRYDSIEGSLSDYIKALDKQYDKNFYVGSYPNGYIDDKWVHIFDGITINDFYKIYFKSGLSKEVILRYLSDTEFIYSVDNQMIEEEVERILNKH